MKSLRTLFVVLTIVSGTLHAQDKGVTEMYSFRTAYNEDEASLRRFYFINGSPARRERFKKFYTDSKSQLEKLPFEQMSVGGKVDWLLLKREIEDKLYRINTEENDYGKLTKYVSLASPLYDIEKLRTRGIHLKSQEVAQQLTDIRKAVVDMTGKLKQEPSLPPALANRAEEIVKGQHTALKSVFDFYNGYDPQFTWWVTKPYQKLDTALTKYAAQLKQKADNSLLPKDDGSGIIGNPIGRDELTRLLQYEMIPYSPEELIDIANKEFAWCDAELLKASREMGFGDNWKQAQEKVKQTYVPEGYQPEAMLKLYNESVDFLKKNDLVTIPPIAEETWRMRMMPPKQQLISPFFLGGEVLQIAYPTNEMDQADKLMSMRGNNPHFSRATVHHELIAGHHLQMFMNDRNKPYRNYYTPFWIEGWALYWEFILWDMKFPRSPEDKIGMLFWRMHRCARIIFSLNYHLGKWTPQQCIDFLVDRVGHERANAEGEVRRSFTANYGPLYQLAYMTGAFQFYALKKELVDSGKMTYKQYHDAVLQENAMPVEMVRAILTHQPLTRDFKTSWRFYQK
ncbi:MAG: DUF885 family protein [Bacteroidetes bacterium]|nr:DUF885 family protein [Bacteroidota bacterium]MBS1540064.1 DUF885 family protein [Bacteroidota bacterium]